MNVAIITARAGSKSIINKNVLEVAGCPIIHYPITAAMAAVGIDKVFVSTDGELIADAARDQGAEIIPRPQNLAGDTINHGDVIKHAVHWVRERYSDLDKVVLLLGNTVYVDGIIIDKCLNLLDENSDLDSCMTVWEAQDDHPYRAMSINKQGFLVPFGKGNRNVSTERQSYEMAYYYDQGVWAFRQYTVDSQDGVNPWWWMGEKSKPIIRTWVTGRDIHNYFDVAISEWWVTNKDEIKPIINKSSKSGL